MQIIADLQIHSKYSRAVSYKMDLFEISRWAFKKGIDIVATGDWTHPLWFREITTHLKEVSPGIFTLKDKPADQTRDVYFLLSTEISSIYTQGGQARRVHNLIFSPNIFSCERLIKELQIQGCNLLSDGRPIVGVSSADLLETCLDINPHMLFIPAHVWTPWFSIFGSKSGFDSIAECFGSLSKHIYAVETGLSSDPAMNWQIAELDSRSVLSFSDAHSGPKLGREATVFTPFDQNLKFNLEDLRYEDIEMAIKQDQKAKLTIAYTIEFFPEEGKYHLTGHRSCNMRFTPDEVSEKGIICPVCKKPLTIGVEDRVRALSSSTIGTDRLSFVKNDVGVTFVYDKDKKRKPFVSAVPLLEVLGEIYHSPTKSLAEYERLTNTISPEFDILLKTRFDELECVGGKKLAAAIEIVRSRKVTVDPGYDGVFGTVSIFGKNNHEEKQKVEQATLF